jgi:hypothetical protein
LLAYPTPQWRYVWAAAEVEIYLSYGNTKAKTYSSLCVKHGIYRSFAAVAPVFAPLLEKRGIMMQ